MASDVGEIPRMLRANGGSAGCLFSLQDWKIPVEDLADLIARCATDKAFYRELEELGLSEAGRKTLVKMAR